ncbi:hypothetical protein [Massiliimalia massiliensis]|uniref:hypothetical protein n=1 Tax=Massiliimalia massiliensis TaxID=1852384 RepID=UPI000986EC12|nr:hypothetical protein [Massiliimalia massiliensis]
MITAKKLTEIVRSLAEKLAVLFPDYKVMEGFGKEQFYGTAKTPFLSVSLKKVSAEQAGYDDFLGLDAGAGGGTEVYGKLAAVTIGFLFGFPLSRSQESGSLFLSLCSALLAEPEYGFQEISCGETGFDPAMQCFTLQAQAVTQVMIVKEEEYLPVKEIVVRPLAEGRTET